MKANKNNLYIRIIRKADLTVFNVDADQKTYFDPITRSYLSYSPAQQVKRNLIEKICELLNQPLSGYTFTYSKDKDGKLIEKNAYGTLNPEDIDQLLGGYMKTSKEQVRKTKKKGSEADEIETDDSDDGKDSTNLITITRTSPFSISNMIPLSGYLFAKNAPSKGTVNRKNVAGNTIIFLDEKNNQIADSEVDEFLNEHRGKNFASKLLKGKTLSSGIFVQDIVIDLRRLFSVSINSYTQQVTKETQEQLIANGWIEKDTPFGKVLELPDTKKEIYKEAIAEALLSFRTMTNQSSAYSPNSILAVAVTHKVQYATNTIRAEISTNDEGNNIATVIVEPSNNGDYNTFIDKSAENVFNTGCRSDLKAIDNAYECILASL